MASRSRATFVFRHLLPAVLALAALLSGTAVAGAAEPGRAALARTAADELVEMVLQKHVGAFQVHALKMGPAGAARSAFTERVERTAPRTFVTRLFDDEGKLFWTSQWTVEPAAGPRRVRL